MSPPMVAVDGELAVGVLHGGGEHMCWQEQEQQQQQPRQQERRDGKSVGLNVSPASLPTSRSFISFWAYVGPSKGKRESSRLLGSLWTNAHHHRKQALGRSPQTPFPVAR